MIQSSMYRSISQGSYRPSYQDTGLLVKVLGDPGTAPLGHKTGFEKLLNPVTAPLVKFPGRLYFQKNNWNVYFSAECKKHFIM